MKRNKKALAAVLAAAVTMAAVLTAFLVSRRDGSETVVTVFEKANFDQVSCRVGLEAYLDGEYHMLTEKEELLKRLYAGWMEAAGEEACEPSVVREDQERESVISLCGDPEQETELSLYTMEEAADGVISQENYLQVRVCLEGDQVDEALGLQESLGQAAAAMGIGETAYLEMEGSFSGLLSREEQEIVAEALLDRMGARKVAAVDEEQLYTVYAYVEGAGTPVQLPEGPANLNLAVSRNEAEEKTVFCLGCPVIRGDY